MRKVAILGFANTSLPEAPWADPSWEKWILNDMWQAVPAGSFHRVFELHDTTEDYEGHLEWLRANAEVPVYMTHPRADTPQAVAYPVEEVCAKFGSYFTNTVSWMIALALHEHTELAGYEEVSFPDGTLHREPILKRTGEDLQIGLWGVDLAAGGEYAAQRPSCEYFVGKARGLGVPVYIPAHSDICKIGVLYGVGTDSPFVANIEGRITELSNRHLEMNQQLQTLGANINHVNGGLEAFRYCLDVWANPRGGRVVGAP